MSPEKAKGSRQSSWIVCLKMVLFDLWEGLVVESGGSILFLDGASECVWLCLVQPTAALFGFPVACFLPLSVSVNWRRGPQDSGPPPCSAFTGMLSAVTFLFPVGCMLVQG